MFDLEAELFELLHQVAASTFGVDAAFVVVAADLVVGDTLEQHPPDHHEEVVADGVERLVRSLVVSRSGRSGLASRCCGLGWRPIRLPRAWIAATGLLVGICRIGACRPTRCCRNTCPPTTPRCAEVGKTLMSTPISAMMFSALRFRSVTQMPGSRHCARLVRTHAGPTMWSRVRAAPARISGASRSAALVRTPPTTPHPLPPAGARRATAARPILRLRPIRRH